VEEREMLLQCEEMEPNEKNTRRRLRLQESLEDTRAARRTSQLSRSLRGAVRWIRSS
jgi:hypothetical protein